MRYSAILMAAVAVFSFGSSVAGAQEKVLYSFSFNKISPGTDGASPSGSLVFDKAGNLFGATLSGGTGDAGGVFELSPKAGGGWTEKMLTDSTGKVLGAGSKGSLIFDASGNLYGTGSGGVFELSPATGGLWKEQMLYTFAGETDVNAPNPGLIFDKEGNLYGTSLSGGEYFAYGTVFELSPKTGGGWTEKILHSFDNNFVDGYRPLSSLVFDAKGNLYGTTSYGGANGMGTVFELTPETSGLWTEKILFNQQSAPYTGSTPYADLIFDADGNLYSTAYAGGAGGQDQFGTVFELSLQTSGAWTEQTLHNFTDDATDGGEPASGLIFDAKGNLYSTTFHGGPFYTQNTANTDGTIFELLPQSSGGWAEDVLHIFGSVANDGILPSGGVISDTKGNLYGVTSGGGTYGYGTVYEYTPVVTADLPVFTPNEGVYSTPQTVTIKDGTSGATIYYTIDGTTPTTSSLKYSASFAVSKTTTVKAIAVHAGVANSPVATATYTIEATTATPVIAPPGGKYTAVQMVTITDATPGAYIYYTTNGAPPTTSSSFYGGPIPVSVSETIEAIAMASGDLESGVAKASYTLPPRTPTPAIVPTGGAFVAPVQVKITDATAGAVIYYTTNGTLPTTASTKYTAPFTVSATGFVHAIAVAPGDLVSLTATARFTIGATALTPEISPAAGSYATAQTVYIVDFTQGATIFYTTNGTAPTAKSTLYSGPVTVSKSETVEAIAVAPGYKNSAIATASYQIGPPAAAPVFTPVAGTYNSIQAVKITDSTAGATIYYTTSGIAPTTASTKYTAAIPVTTSETLQAIAVAPSYTTSPVASAKFTLVAATPTFSPAPGTYTAAQKVALKDATPGAVIYYTTNGTAPTTGSTKYAGTAISVGATEKIEAIAVATGFVNSVVASGAYTINLASPAVSPGGSDYGWYYLDSSCNREPYGVVYNYDTASATINAQLKQMYLNGQRRLRIPIFHARGINSGTIMDSTGGSLSSRFQANLANLLAAVKSAGFVEVEVSFHPQSANNPIEWTTFSDDYFQENWKLIQSLRTIIAAAGIPYHLDLMNEGIPPPGWTVFLQYSQMLWNDYVAKFGSADTLGFSIISDAGHLSQVSVVYGASPFGNHGSPLLFDVHIYDETGSSFATAFNALKSQGYQGIGWIIGEAYYNDAAEAESIRQEINSTGQKVLYLTQWPLTSAETCSTAVNVAPPANFSNYHAQNF